MVWMVLQVCLVHAVVCMNREIPYQNMIQCSIAQSEEMTRAKNQVDDFLELYVQRNPDKKDDMKNEQIKLSVICKQEKLDYDS